MNIPLLFPVVAILGIFPVTAVNADAPMVDFRGNHLRPITIEPDANTGLDNIYVLYDTAGVDLVFPLTAAATVNVYRYGNLGGGYAERVDDVIIDDSSLIIPDIEGNFGYIIEVNDKRYYYWIVEYLPYRLSIDAISASDDQDCDATILNIDGVGGAIHYYTINGQQRELSREINIDYDTQIFDEDSAEYKVVNQTKIISSFNDIIRISPASLCQTFFRVTGDRFLKSWNWGIDVESVAIPPFAVAVTTTAIQDDLAIVKSDGSSSDDGSLEADDSVDSEGSNVISDNSDSLGGSAPADITFEAYTSEGVLHYEWQMSRDPEFENIDFRFNVRELDYTFLEEGDYYLRFVGSNSDGSCESIGDTYTVSIGSSELLCPNAFTPDGDGVNDQWKVSYRSIVEFDCWIFDRYGAEIIHFSDPQLGWDGTRGGKTVSPGVYYYVISAVGADGKKYKLSGDINILRRKVIKDVSGSGEE